MVPCFKDNPNYPVIYSEPLVGLICSLLLSSAKIAAVPLGQMEDADVNEAAMLHIYVEEWSSTHLLSGDPSVFCTASNNLRGELSEDCGSPLGVALIEPTLTMRCSHKFGTSEAIGDEPTCS